ncbi:MAG: DMT family transporter [Pseudomonadota bacterium]
MSRGVHSATNTTLATGRQKWLGHLAALSFALLIAGSFSIGHLAAPHMTPPALNGLRFILAASLLATLYVARRSSLPPPPRPKSFWRFALIGALMATYFITMFMALRITSPVSTGAVFTLIPLMSAGFGYIILRQTTGPVVLFSLLVAAAGALWVIFKGDLQALLSFRIGQGELIFFVGCVGHALVAPLVKLLNRGEDGLTFTLGTVSGTMVCVLLVGLGDLVDTDLTTMPPIVWVAIAYLAIFTTATTFFLVQYASMRLPASKVLSYGYLTPVAVILIEGAIGHGWPSLSIMIGAGITAAALAVMAVAAD